MALFKIIHLELINDNNCLIPITSEKLLITLKGVNTSHFGFCFISFFFEVVTHSPWN